MADTSFAEHLRTLGTEERELPPDDPTRDWPPGDPAMVWARKFFEESKPRFEVAARARKGKLLLATWFSFEGETLRPKLRALQAVLASNRLKTQVKIQPLAGPGSELTPEQVKADTEYFFVDHRASNMPRELNPIPLGTHTFDVGDPTVAQHTLVATW